MGQRGTSCGLKSAVFWGITLRRVVIVYRISGQPFGPIFTGQESEWELLIREDGTVTLSRNVGKQLPHDAA
jgi:hypothetical protein